MTTIYSGRPGGTAKAQAWLTYSISSETATTVVYNFSMGLVIDSGVVSSRPWGSWSFEKWTGSGGSMDKAVEYEAGQSGTVTGATWATTFTKASNDVTHTRALQGWYDKTNGSTEFATKTYTITISAIPTQYTVTYNANGGTGAPDQQTYYQGYPTTVSTKKPTRANYLFTHWEDADGAPYDAGDTLPSSGNIVLKAQWEFVQSSAYVYYNGNGFSGAPAAAYITNTEANPTQYSWTAGSMSDQTKYRFKGWSTSSSGGVSYYGGVTYNISGGMTVYAVWEYISQSYTITYNAMGGSGAPQTQTWNCQTVTGNSVTLSSTQPTKSGFTFVGWARSSSATTAQYTSGQTITLGDSDGSFSLYAIWERDTSYTYKEGSLVNSQWRTFMMYKYTVGENSVVVDFKSGVIIEGTQTTSSFTNNGSAVDNSGESSTVTWSSTVGAIVRLTGTTIVINEQTITLPRTATTHTVSLTSTLYAGSASSTTSSVADTISVPNIRTYPVTYNANGGSSAPATQYKAYGYALTLTTAKPLRPSYRFVGWNTDPEATTAQYVGGESYTDNAELNLYAIWTLAYYEQTVEDLTGVVAISEWKNDTVAALTGTSIYQIDVGGNMVGPLTIDTYTGTPQMFYNNGQLVVITNEYTAFISSVNSGITYKTTNVLVDGAGTTYGVFGLTSSGGTGSLTVPSR